MKDILFQMAEKADDGIMYVLADGSIGYWNRGCENIFGIKKEEALGANLDIIIPEKHRKRHWDGFYKTLETGYTRYVGKMLKVPALSRSGEKLIIEFSIQIIEEEGRRVGFTSIVRAV